MYWIYHSHLEEFIEWLPLTRLKGEQSFISLRSFNGINCGSYKNSFLAGGLVKDDNEWTLKDAVNRQIPSQFRTLLAHIFEHCNPVNFFDLWLRFKNDLSEDFIKEIPK